MESRGYDRVDIEQAEYKEQVIYEYMGNPLTEALPNIMSKKEVISSLSNYPNFNSCERELDSHYRLHLIQRVFQYYQPLPIHLDLESRISRLLRQGYINRNPLQHDFVRNFFQGREDIVLMTFYNVWILTTLIVLKLTDSLSKIKRKQSFAPPSFYKST